MSLRLSPASNLGLTLTSSDQFVVCTSHYKSSLNTPPLCPSPSSHLHHCRVLRCGVLLWNCLSRLEVLNLNNVLWRCLHCTGTTAPGPDAIGAEHCVLLCMTDFFILSCIFLFYEENTKNVRIKHQDLVTVECWMSIKLSLSPIWVSCSLHRPP